MLKTKMISAMKFSKDTMSNPLPDTTLDKLVAVYKSTGATHIEIATVLGRPNWLTESKRWADRIHSAGMFVTWRCASDAMEGLYGVTKAVGANRKPLDYYKALAVDAIINNPSLFKSGDEWAIYPERTEGIWQDSTSWIWPNDPTTYANFFVDLANACETAFNSIGKVIKTGLQANNGSELLPGWWMNPSLVNRAGYVVADHYVDGNPTQLKADLRAMKAHFGKPVYLQETAPHRFSTPTSTQITEYFNALTELVNDGTLEAVGFWGGWSGNPESILNADCTLNAQGLALKAFYAPQQTPDPAPVIDLSPVLDEIKDLKLAIDSRILVEKIEDIVWGSGTLSTKISKIKALLPQG